MFDVLNMLEAESVGYLLNGGRSLIGTYDLAQYTQQMNSLKQVTVAIARALLKGGQAVIDASIAAAKGGMFSRELPGQSARQNVKGHLAWHADHLAQLSDPTAPYDAAQDLKKWVLQAYIESNAVEEGRATQDQAWQDMWTDIGTELANMPATIARVAAQATGDVVSAAGSGLAHGLGIPTWVFWAGGAALVLGLGFGAFKILLIAAPTAVPALVKRYLP